ncbi:MAG: hypothetical protein M3409_00825 [Gemmatimonadota bacterium]|nr:hypothetical protein [Gemmatimonadota bacterium]
MNSRDSLPFVVGRFAKDGRRLLVLRPGAPPPIPGPWELCGVFSGERHAA